MRAVIAFGLMSLFVASVQAATIKYDTTQTVTAPLAITEATTIEVAKGAVVTYAPSAVISGSKPITKTGDGDLLVCSPNGDFTGGFTVSAGYLIASNSTAFGTADMTVLGQRDGYKGKCAVGFWGVGGKKGDKTAPSPIYYANNIKVTGSSNGTYPALIGYGRAAQLTGTIVASKDFYFIDDYVSVVKDINGGSHYDAYTITNLVFNGAIDVKGVFSQDGWSSYVFKNKVKAKAFDGTNWRKVDGSSNWNAYYHFYDTCSFNVVTNHRHNLYLYTADVFKGAEFQWVWKTKIGDAHSGNVYVYGNNQSVAALNSATNGIPLDDKVWYYGICGSVNTLKITGIGTGPYEAATVMSLAGVTSLELNARKEFTQTFLMCTNTTKGTLTANVGTIRIANNASFPNLTGMSVGAEGAIVVESTHEKVYPALKNLSVAGRFSVGKEVAQLPTLTKFELFKGNIWDAPAFTNITTSTLYIDGTQIPQGTWNWTSFPEVMPTGMTVVVKSGSWPAPSDTLNWVGLGPDNLMTTLLNWQGPPASVDLETGSLKANVVSGDGMMYHDQAWVNGIEHKIPFTNEEGVALGPFVIEPETKGGTLVISKQLLANYMGQIVLRGHIAGPYGVIQPYSEDTAISLKIMKFDKRVVDPTKAGVVLGSTSGNAAQIPILLDGAIVDKHVRLRCYVTQCSAIVGQKGTYNEINGHLVMDSYQTVFTPLAGSKIVFTGGIESFTSLRFGGTGTILITGEKYTNIDNYSFIHDGMKLIIDATDCIVGGNYNGEGIGIDKGSLEFLRDRCLADDNVVMFDNQTELASVEFNATTQRWGRVGFVKASSGAGSYLHGDYPAMMEVTGKWVQRYEKGKPVYYPTDKRSSIVDRIGGPGLRVYGSLGIHVCGSEANLTLTNCNFESTGNLEVSAGTLTLAPDATWLNGTNFVLRGTGTLCFTKDGQIDRKTAELMFSESGQIEIPEGVTLKVHRVYVNGEEVEQGTYYGGATTGPLADRITGKGALSVHGSFRGSIIRFW